MRLQPFKPIFFVISLLSLLALILVNVAKLMGRSAPFELSFIQIFFVLFPLWAFTIYYLNQNKPDMDEASVAGMDLFQKIRRILGNPPNWAMILLAAFYLYGMYSFFLFMTGGIVDPEYVNGQYQFNNHGQITVYSEAEYQTQHGLYLRSITGFFMAFFSVSTVVLAPWPAQPGDSSGN